MTFVQLQYIIAIDTYRHFAVAAKHCFVSQPTLSMQVQKAEDELGVKIFDRSKQPVIPTELGAELIEQARKIIAEKGILEEMVMHKKGIVAGELKINHNAILHRCYRLANRTSRASRCGPQSL